MALGTRVGIQRVRPWSTRREPTSVAHAPRSKASGAATAGAGTAPNAQTCACLPGAGEFRTGQRKRAEQPALRICGCADPPLLTKNPAPFDAAHSKIH
jgi:hypothetical protein